MNTKNIDTLLKETLSKAKYYETETDFLDDIENGYIRNHVNEKNVMRKAEDFKEDYYNGLTCIEDLSDFKWELENVYGIYLNNIDEKELKYELSGFDMVYIDETETYYII